MSKKDQPFFKMWVQDFMTDEKLRQCNAHANGVYIWIMLLMTKQEEIGRILLKQKFKQTPKQIESKYQGKIQANQKHLLVICYSFASQLSKHLPFSEEDILSGILELLMENVLHIEGETLLQKRMVRDASISAKRAVSGGKGGKRRIANHYKSIQETQAFEAGVLLNQKPKQNDSKSVTIIDGNNYTGKGEVSGEGNSFVSYENGPLNHAPQPYIAWFHTSYEDFMKFSKSVNNLVTEDDFNEWKEFLLLCDNEEHKFYEQVFNGKFLSPKDFVLIKEKLPEFNKSSWIPVLTKLSSVGMLPHQNIFFRIQDVFKWKKSDEANTGRRDQAAKTVGGKQSDFSDNTFQ